MSKSTAVEWLVTQLRNRIEEGTLDAIAISKLKMQAKAMEREQMGEAFDESRLTNQWCILTESAFQYKSFEDYYNQTYKGGEQ